MTNRQYILFLCILLAIAMMSCQQDTYRNAAPVIIREITKMPSPKASAVACTMGNKIYIFGGRDSQYSNRLWCYDSTDSTWSSVDTPLKPRVKAVMQTDGTYLYMGLGYGGGGAYQEDAYFQDWWRYEPDGKTWTPLCNYPTPFVVSAVSAYYQNSIFVLFGSYHDAGNDCYQYIIDNNEWQAVKYTNSPFIAKGATGCLIDGDMYVGLGWYGKNINCLQRMNTSSHTWETLPSMPGKGRICSSSTTTKDLLYIFGGRLFAGSQTGGKVYDDIWRYNITDACWEYVQTMPCGKAENQIAFTLNGKAGFGLGENEDGKLIDAIYIIEE